MIPQRNLSLLSNRLIKEGRRIPEGVLERDYCLSWFLVGLSKTSLKDILVFKGGTAIKKFYVAEYRFSEDLDFTLVGKYSFEDIMKNFHLITEKVYEASGISMYFGKLDRHKHKNSYTFFLDYKGPLPSSFPKKVKVDITIEEKIVFPVKERTLLKSYREYADLPEKTKLSVYSIEEIAAEKVIAIQHKARNEPRDLYDIWYLIVNKHINLINLVEAVQQKWNFRGRKLSEMMNEFRQKEDRLKKLWKVRLSPQVAALPEFEQAYRTVKRELRHAGLLK